MDYILLKKVLNIIKLQLWHKSNRRICIRGYMICCDECNKEYMKEFDGCLCARIFFKKKGYNCSRDIVPKLNSLTFCYNLSEFELDIVLNIFAKYFDTITNKSSKTIKIAQK